MINNENRLTSNENTAFWGFGATCTIAGVAGIVAVLWVTTMPGNFVYTSAGTSIVATGTVLGICAGIPGITLLTCMTINLAFPSGHPQGLVANRGTQGSINFND